MKERLQSIINVLDTANGWLAEIVMDTIDAEDKDMLRDCMDKLDNVKEILEDLQI